MPDLDIGGGGGIGGIPTRYVLIGAGVLGVGALLLMQRRATAAPVEGNAPSYGTALGPNAAVALGSLETTNRQQFGDLQQQIEGLFDANAVAASANSAAASADLHNLFGAQSDQLATGFGYLGHQLVDVQSATIGEANEIRTELSALLNPSGGQHYRDLETAWAPWWVDQTTRAHQAVQQTIGTAPGMS